MRKVRCACLTTTQVVALALLELSLPDPPESFELDELLVSLELDESLELDDDVLSLDEESLVELDAAPDDDRVPEDDLLSVL